MLLINSLMLLIIAFSLISCGGKYRASKKSMSYMKSGDIKFIDEKEKKPLVILINGTSDYKTKDSFVDVYKTLEQFMYYERNFDSKVLQLYSPSAYMQYTRYDPAENSRTTVMSFKAYSDLFQDLIEDLKSDNDYNEYSDFRFDEEGKGYVRVSAKKYNKKRKWGNISWLFGKTESGDCIIFEEIVETRY